jgi:xanthine dehydrogenase YagT iron-sulfur-binding subunit
MRSLEIGIAAPDFSFLDADGAVRTLAEFRGGPAIVAFGRAQRDTQPDIQFVTFEGERLPLITPSADVADRYAAAAHFAVYVVGSDGAIVWRHAPPDAEILPPSAASGLSRREFLAAALAASVAASIASTGVAAFATPEPLRPEGATLAIAFIVNGQPAHLTVDPRVTLLDALRERLRLTGTKKGCDHGQCGACTVHVDGRRVLSCLTLAASVQGRSITTVEGLADGDRLHAVQQAFIDHDAFQCGYCTSGQIMSAVALLHEPCGEEDEAVREGMSGNICRCGAYPGIVVALQSVRGNRS